MQNYQHFDMPQKNYDFYTKYAIFGGKTELKLLSQIDQNINTKNDQNSVFVSEAVQGENAI